MDDNPAYQLCVFRETSEVPAADTSILTALRSVLSRQGAARAQVNVLLVDDARITALNETHLQHVGPTDVLTFDLSEGAADRTTPGEAVVEGEIVISIETAQREAVSRGHAPEAEAALYAVHGALHLLGFDDTDEEQARRMHAEEDEVLSSLGMGRVYGGGEA